MQSRPLGAPGRFHRMLRVRKSTTQQQRLFLPVKFELPWTTAGNYLASKDNDIQRLTPPPQSPATCPEAFLRITPRNFPRITPRNFPRMAPWNLSIGTFPRLAMEETFQGTSYARNLIRSPSKQQSGCSNDNCHAKGLFQSGPCKGHFWRQFLPHSNSRKLLEWNWHFPRGQQWKLPGRAGLQVSRGHETVQME